MISDVHSHSKLYTGIKSRCNVLSGTVGPGSGISDFLFFFTLESQLVQEGCEIKRDIRKRGLRQSGLPLMELADKEKNVCGAPLKHSALCGAGNSACLLDCNLSLDSRSRLLRHGAGQQTINDNNNKRAVHLYAGHFLTA